MSAQRLPAISSKIKGSRLDGPFGAALRGRLDVPPAPEASRRVGVRGKQKSDASFEDLIGGLA